MSARFRRPPAAWTACAAMVVSAAGVMGTVLRAQDPQTSQAPVFKSGVDLIAVDVNVVDKSGAPVRSVAANQFVVTVDGRPRRVLSAELIDHSPPPNATARPEQEAESGPAYSSNDRPWRSSHAGRLFYLLVDQGSFRAGGTKAMVAATRRFVQALQPTDRVGLAAFPGERAMIAATADHSVVRLALSSLVGLNQPLRTAGTIDLSLAESADIGAEDASVFSSTVGRECRGLTGVARSACADRVREEARSMSLNAEVQTRTALAEIQRIVRALEYTDERKTLVLVSAGLPASDRSSGNFDLTTDITQVAAEAAKANASLYVLHVDTSFLDAYSSSEQHVSRTVARDSAITGAGLDTLAGASGGTLFRVSNGAETAFDRVLRETSSSYVLGLEPLESDRDGKPHELRVAVTLPNAQVRARREFILAPSTRTAAATPLEVVLTSPWPAKGLPLGVSTHTMSGEAGGGVRVLVSAEVGRDLAGGGEFMMGLTVKDAQGRVIVSSPPENARLMVPPGDEKGSGAYVATLVLPPGEYRLRLAAIDDKGRTGSVDHGFTAALAEGQGVRMSDLVLLHPARAVTDPLAIINDGRVTIDKLAAHLAVFPAGASSTPHVTFGIADRVGGPLLVKSEGSLAKGAARDESAADAVLDLTLLPPGKYTAVAIVTDGARQLGARYQPLYVERPAGGRAAAVPNAVGTSGVVPRVQFVPSLSSSLVKTFARTDVLAPAALGYFANRLAQADAAPPASVASTIADFRDARFDVVLESLSHAPSAGLSAAFLKGVALLGNGQPEPAVTELKNALRAANDFLPAAFYLGACYAALGKDEMAVGAWQTALATEGDARIVYDVLVDALLRLNDADQAIQVLDEAQGRWPDDEAFLSRRAAAEAMQGRRADAVATLGRYLDKHRADTEAAALAIRLIYEARSSGQTLTSLESDREAAARYGEWYRAAGGANRALVDRWLDFIAKK